METNKIYLGDNLELLKQLEDNSIHSCVSDFPYNLGFMGKKWDTITNYQDWCYQRAVELFRVMKSGGICLIFGGTRTHHRLVCAFEDAGFEIKDEMQWIYASGFPKSYNISKGFDKRIGGATIADEIMKYIKEYRIQKGVSVSKLDKDVFNGSTKYSRWYEERNDGRLPTEEDWFKLKEYLKFDDKYDELIVKAEREKVGEYKQSRANDGSWATDKKGDMFKSGEKTIEITLSSTDLAKQWDGWGTALKPAQEPIMVCQKPIEKNYCYNIEKHGVGGININDCRVEYNNEADLTLVKAKCNFTENSKSIGFGTEESLYGKGSTPLNQARDCVHIEGRFPSNLILDEEAGKLLDEQSGERPSGKANGDAKVGETSNGVIAPMRRGNLISRNDTGGASRFFYCPKASKKDKTENGLINNTHVTVKPTELIKYLVKLVTPPKGICLDICEGSGTHVKAVLELNKEGFDFNYIGFEKDEESYNIACEREKIHKIAN